MHQILSQGELYAIQEQEGKTGTGMVNGIEGSI